MVYNNTNPGYRTMYWPYTPYQYPVQTPGYSVPMTQQENNRIIGVTGINGAKTYAQNMPPNSKDIVFDDSEDIFYFISTDAGGFPTIKDFVFVPKNHEESVPQPDNYATKTDLEKIQSSIDSLASKFNELGL